MELVKGDVRWFYQLLTGWLNVKHDEEKTTHYQNIATINACRSLCLDLHCIWLDI